MFSVTEFFQAIKYLSSQYKRIRYVPARSVENVKFPPLLSLEPHQGQLLPDGVELMRKLYIKPTRFIAIGLLYLRKYQKTVHL